MATVDLTKVGAPGANGLSLLSEPRDPYSDEGHTGELFFNYVSVVFFKKFMVGGWKPILRLAGKKGPPGRSGVGVQSALVNVQGNLILTMSDGGQIDAGHVVGAAGLTGDGSGDMLRSLNLSDVENKDTGLVNLGGTSVGRAVFKALTATAAREVLDALQVHARLTAFRDLPVASGQMTYFQGSNTLVALSTTAWGRSLLALASQEATRAALGVQREWTKLTTWTSPGGNVGAVSFPLPAGTSEVLWVGEELSHSHTSAQNLIYLVSTNGGTTWSSAFDIGDGRTALSSDVVQMNGHMFVTRGPDLGPLAVARSAVVIDGNANTPAEMRSARYSGHNIPIDRIRFQWSQGSFDGGTIHMAVR